MAKPPKKGLSELVFGSHLTIVTMVLVILVPGGSNQKFGEYPVVPVCLIQLEPTMGLEVVLPRALVKSQPRCVKDDR